MNKYIGHDSQLYGIEEHRLIGGKGDGMRLYEVQMYSSLRIGSPIRATGKNPLRSFIT